VAEHIAKTVDVDKMLSEMSHEQFDEWCAKDMIEPIGSMQPVCEILAKIGKMIAAFMGHEMKDEHFMPWIAKKTKRAASQLTPRQSAVALTNHLRVLAGGG
jgi:hypothetical protein